MSLSPKTRKVLWSRAGNKCAFSGCDQNLTDDIGDDEGVVIGEEAHIVARVSKGPRGDQKPPGGDLDGVANLILLCPTHHRFIDGAPDMFSVAALREMKESHEHAVRLGRNGPSDNLNRGTSERTLAENGLPLFASWRFDDSQLNVQMFGSEPVMISESSWVGAGLFFELIQGESATKIGSYSEADPDILFSIDGSVLTLVEQVFDDELLANVPFLEKSLDFSSTPYSVRTRRLIAPKTDSVYDLATVRQLYEKWLSEGTHSEIATLRLRTLGLNDPQPVLTFIHELREGGQIDGVVAECASAVYRELRAYSDADS